MACEGLSHLLYAPFDREVRRLARCDGLRKLSSQLALWKSFDTSFAACIEPRILALSKNGS